MTLSEEQRSALWDESGQPVEGLRVLSARPGTGKTWTVAQYCVDVTAGWHRQREPWQGIAVLSYTNVAKDEVESRVRRTGAAHVLLRSPNFVGTLDAFINQQIFLPHGARTMGYTAGRPELVGEPYFQWKFPWKLHHSSPTDAYKPVWFDCYTLSKQGRPLMIDGTPRAVGGRAPARPQAVSNANVEKISAMKRHVWANGKALQADANYLAYKTVQSSPALAKALAGRFPALVVDEAQDMTEIQHAIIDVLIAAGLQHVVLVGDENQAIYEWNTARPDLFTARKTADGWQGSVLRESHRCSPAICSALTVMADDGVILTPAATAKNAGYLLPVDVRSYVTSDDATAIREAIDSITEALADLATHDGNEAGVKTLAVISRSGEDTSRLRAQYTGISAGSTQRQVWNSPLTRDFLKTIHHIGNRQIDQAVRVYEQLLHRASGYSTVSEMRASLMREAAIGPTDKVGYRVLLFNDLNLVGNFVHDSDPLHISDCARIADLPLTGLRPYRHAEIRADCASFGETGKIGQDQLLSALFSARDERTWITHANHPASRIVFATAHALKGETYDAVLLYTKRQIHACGCPQSAATWASVLQHSVLQCETKRIAYVACSRAAQALVILAPAVSLDAWRKFATPVRV